jgi:hypothetical protein
MTPMRKPGVGAPGFQIYQRLVRGSRELSTTNEQEIKRSNEDFLLPDELRSFVLDYGIADVVGPPSTAMRAWLAAQGVPETALSGWAGLSADNCGACPSPLLAGRVIWHGNRFTFDPHGAVACVIIECCAEEPIDVVAFDKTRIAGLLAACRTEVSHRNAEGGFVALNFRRTLGSSSIA